MDIKRKVKGWLKGKPNKELEALKASQKAHDTFLIALARLTFIKPSNLMREAQNIKANAEYLLKMTEEVQKGKGAK